MKALVICGAIGLAAFPILANGGGSSFKSIDVAEAALVNGGACYQVIAFGCQPVLTWLPKQGWHLGSGEGCGNLAGTKSTFHTGEFSFRGNGTWCSDSQSYSCGMAITTRYTCASAPGSGDAFDN